MSEKMIFGKHINKYYLKYLWMLLIGLVALVAVDYFQLLIPEYLRTVLNGINTGEVIIDGQTTPFTMETLLTHVCFPLLIVVAIIVIGRFAWRMCFLGSAVKVESEMRSEMFDRARFLSPRFYRENKVGSLMALFTNDLETIQESFGWGVMMFFDAVFLGSLAIVKMWRMNYVLTLYCMLPMIFLLVVSAIVGHFEMKKWDKRQMEFSKLTDSAQESFSGLAVIKAFVRELKQLLTFGKICKENEQVNVEYTRIRSVLEIFITLFVQSVMCIILGYGGYVVWHGGFNSGQLIEFIGYFNSVIWPIMAVSQLIDMRARGTASLKRISNLLDTQPEITDSPDVLPIDKIEGEIEFKNLSFRYPDGESDELKDISLHIAKGEHVGIIGRTGAGKTTLVNLIMRAFNAPRGTLFIDGNDICRIPLKTLRNGIAYVPQDNFLFSDTVKNNIAFSVEEENEVSLEKVRRAAACALVASDVEEFSDRYETKLGERGVTVSGGQKQRISIARALMKDAPILILDDSLSAVDTDTEKSILDNLAQVRKDKTTLLIAHRVSAVERMDKIIFLENGSIKAAGTHSQLMESSREYARLVALQQLEEDREADNE
ncbi:MAG TPA: ABC transporter ATP-binding protein/permease [Firmicutes bacterium]|nr:ABC transporter ATP-binding protein/permease [Bacillota bacterium]